MPDTKADAPAPDGAPRHAAGAEFARQASEAPPGFFAELWDFIAHNKKWWITPIVVALLVIGALIVLGSTAAGPFIYTLF